jgi:hypothetical protein
MMYPCNKIRRTPHLMKVTLFLQRFRGLKSGLRGLFRSDVCPSYFFTHYGKKSFIEGIRAFIEEINQFIEIFAKQHLKLFILYWDES